MIIKTLLAKTNIDFFLNKYRFFTHESETCDDNDKGDLLRLTVTGLVITVYTVLKMWLCLSIKNPRIQYVMKEQSEDAFLFHYQYK